MSRRWSRRAASLHGLCLGALFGGCAAWPDWRNGSFQHAHDNFCGHGYLQDMYPSPSPGDFAGSDAWRGPLSENEIRWHDPFRGDRPSPDRPMDWWVPGNGNPADRTLPGRSAPHTTNAFPETRTRGDRGAGSPPVQDRRGLPHWPLEQGLPNERE